jgi:hypothetical protein
MKHASADTLRQIEGVLAELRTLPGLREKSPGAFYRKGSAFLHFHEDPAGVFADVKVEGDWTRRAINNRTAQAALLRDVRRLLA